MMIVSDITAQRHMPHTRHMRHTLRMPDGLRNENAVNEAEVSLPGIAEKVERLSRADIYPDPTRDVETKETHMAWVFLTDTHAYKLKKPVRYDFLDFSTLEARRQDCEEEVRLNRRLAPDVYLGTLPLTLGPQGALQLGGEGEPVDWLVKMRRLPADRMLDQAIIDRTVSAADVRRVGVLLAGFYQHALPIAMTAAEYRRRLMEDIEADQRELTRLKYALPVDLLKSTIDAQLKFLEEEPELLAGRVRAGKIIEAHGDLRPEHICLGREPVIIDCLEFNRDFRILDTASELAFLALECERLGATNVGQIILETYSDETGDRPPQRLLIFYRSFHACLRAKIAVWHLKDHVIHDHRKWIDRAKHYLYLGAGTAAPVKPQMNADLADQRRSDTDQMR